MMNKISQIISKTKARNTFPSLYDQAEKGMVFAIAERGRAMVALAPLELLYGEDKIKKTPLFSKTAAFGLFRNRFETKDAVSFVRGLRQKRLKRIYDH